MKEKLVIGYIGIFTIVSFLLDSLVISFVGLIQSTYLDHLADFVGSIWMILFLYIAFSLSISKKRRIPFIWIGAFITCIISYVFKFIILRDRIFAKDIPIIGLPDYSFPSTHTALVFFMIPLVWHMKRKYFFAFLIGAIFVAFGRIYLAEHYLSDVMGGALLGLILGFYAYKQRNKINFFHKLK